MKIFLICSKSFYGKIPNIKEKLERNGHSIVLPNCYDAPETEQKMKDMGGETHRQFKSEMIRHSENVIRDIDAVLVLNFDKEKNSEVLKNYIGGATFLEMYDAFRLNKKIYLLNDIPEGMLNDEIKGFNPKIINGDIEKI